MLLRDSIVTNEELFSIDSAITYYYRSYDDENKQETIAGFISLMKNHKASVYGVDIRLNNYSNRLFNMLMDRRVDSAEIALANTPATNSLTDTLWYSNLFGSRYFNKEKDTLTIAQRMKIDSAFHAELKSSYTDFCSDLQKLIKVLKVDVDSSNTLRCF